MPTVRTRRVPRHHRHTHRASRKTRSDQARFLLIITMLAVMAICLGAATKLFHP